MKRITLPQKAIAARAEQMLWESLPVEQKTLQRAMKLLEPKNLKLLGITAVGSMAALSLLGSLGRTGVYRAAVAKELKKQLEPVNRKLDELEAQNEELKRQNEELRVQLAAAK